MLVKNLFENALVNPATKGADELWVITGYSSPAIVYKQITRLKQLGIQVKIQVLVGMISLEGIDLKSHEGFKKLTKVCKGNFTCRYVLKKSITHSKNYLWLKNGIPFAGLTGSANYSINAFSGNVIETLTQCDPASIAKLFKKILLQSIDCIDPLVINHFSFFQNSDKNVASYRTTDTEITDLREKSFSSDGLQSITLSLLKSIGSPAVHDRGGINWGHRGNRNKDEAYISVPKYLQGKFFPQLKKPFKVTCDDGQEFVMVAEGTSGKQITTPEGNWQLGLYLRKRMGLKPGVKVELKDFKKYGRSNVNFYKKSKSHYFFDFSVNP